MKLFHISDLHIGKRVNGFSMLEDQRHILEQIVRMAQEHEPDGVLIAGDLYDRSMPSAEAVELADEFLYRFAKLGIPVWLISGNHDCAERIAYGGRMMEQAGIYVSRVFDGTLQKYTLYDKVYRMSDAQCGSMEGNSKEYQQKHAEKPAETENPAADLYLLPYVRPAQVRRFFPEETIENTQQAVEVILKHTELAHDRVNILVMHQFMAGASVCESEEISVGGSDQVSVSAVDGFDYVALGHLHGGQRVGRETVRYCGSPLKYSFSEANHQKSVTVVEVMAKQETDKEKTEGSAAEQEVKETKAGGNAVEQEVRKTKTEGRAAEREVSKMKAEGHGNREIRVSTLALSPRHDLREIRGPLAQLLKPEVYGAADRFDYLHVTLTDEKEILDAIGQLREIYPNIMRLDFEIGQKELIREEIIQPEEKTPMELFAEFFIHQNGWEMPQEMQTLAERIWERGGDSV